jgi:protein O-GlcNAc transferase
MKRVLTFSLWGNNPTYNIGAIKNAELALVFYPGFECWFYIHTESVPSETVEALKLINNVKIIFKSGDLNSCKPMTWRFEAIDDPDVEIMMSRDTDTRILLREKLAVDEWLASDKIFHIMRDHPHHYFTILGGMFGTKKINGLSSWKNIIDTIPQNGSQNGTRDYDQFFLNDHIYPRIKNNSLIHTSFTIFPQENNKCFPIPYCYDNRFVGEYVYADESRSQYHINELLKHKS